MWKLFPPHAKEFIIQLIAENCRTFFFISPQASREIGAGNIGTVISTTTLSDNKATITKVAVGDKVVIFGQSTIHMEQAVYCATSLSLKYSYMELILAVFELTLKQGETLITAQHVKQVAAEAKKLIALRNTAGKVFNMASWNVAVHHMMDFRPKKEFGNEIGLQKYFA